MTMPLLFKILVIWIYSTLLNTYTVTSFQPYHQPHSFFRSGTGTGTEFGRCTVNGNNNACNCSSDKILTFQKPKCKCSPTKMANSKGCNDDESSSGGEESNEKRNGNRNGNDDGNGNSNSNGNGRNMNMNRNIPTIVDAYTPLLNKRLSKLRAHLLEEQIQKPPNPSLNPIQVITLILQELHEQNNVNTSSSSSSSSLSSSSSFSMPESGFRTLIRSSTNIWKNALRKSVGAPNGATEEQLVSALSSAMSRPNNQYQILVGSDDDDNNDDDNGNDDNNDNQNDNKHDKDGNDKNYHLYFPGDVFEYDDGKAWVESQLRHPKTGKLLAILAWSLIQRESDGAWLIDWLDWQDFRDEYRPGIGREEWSRICG